MKRLLALGIVTALAVPVLASAIVFAVEDTSNSTTDNTTKTETSTTTKTPAELSNEMKERVLKRKTELKTKLTNAEKLKIQSKCKASQGVVSSVSGRVKGIETSRTQVYSNVSTHLTKLSEKVKNNNVDTTALDAAIVVLNQKITLFNTDLAAYKLAVADLAQLECATDPDGFKASLETARAAQAKVSQDALDIKAYIKDTIKPLLETIRKQIESKKTEGSN